MICHQGARTSACTEGIVDNPAPPAPGAAPGPPSLHPAPIDRWLAAGTGLMLLVVGAAALRGAGQWGAAPLLIRCHLLAVIVALALTPAILLRRRGDQLHRVMGYGWIAAMALTALSSLFVQTIAPGHFSPIHVLSIYVLVSLPLIVRAARQGRIARHRAMIRGMVTGALVIAGLFTFTSNRLLGSWLFGG